MPHSVPIALCSVSTSNDGGPVVAPSGVQFVSVEDQVDLEGAVFRVIALDSAYGVEAGLEAGLTAVELGGVQDGAHGGIVVALGGVHGGVAVALGGYPSGVVVVQCGLASSARLTGGRREQGKSE